MKAIKRIALFFIGSGLILSLYSCGDDQASEKAEEADYTNVEITRLIGNDFVDYISVVGTVKPINQADLSETTGGIIERYYVEKGDYVQTGDTILVYDNDELKANLHAAEAQYNLAQVNFEKQELVYKDSVISDFEYLTAKYNRDQAEALYEQIKARYDKTFVTAPFPGFVDARYFEKGELVPPASPAVRLLDASKVKIEAGVPERYAGDVKLGDRVEIQIRDLFEEPLHGTISYVGKALNPSNRTFPVEVVIPNKNSLIKPEMIAEVRIRRADYENILIIPEEVVVRTDSGYVVFIADGGKARERMVNIINRKDDNVAVNKGINPGEQLITLGFQNLVDGENIKIVNEVY